MNTDRPAKAERLVSTAFLGLLSARRTQAQGSDFGNPDGGRGYVACGRPGTLPGFALVDSTAMTGGLDADSCRAIAATALHDAGKVRVVTTAQNRFTALQSGEIDVCGSALAWTLGGTPAGVLLQMNNADDRWGPDRCRSARGCSRRGLLSK